MFRLIVLVILFLLAIMVLSACMLSSKISREEKNRDNR